MPDLLEPLTIPAAPTPEVSSPLLTAPPAAPPPPAAPAYQDAITDPLALRKRVFDRSLATLKDLPPTVGSRFSLALKDPRYVDPPTYSKKQQKDAILQGKTLGRRIRGTWELTDNQTGQLIDQQKKTVVRIPYVTDLGPIIFNGSHYSVSNQSRLRSGLYTRQKANGEYEVHANVLPGSGVQQHYQYDPAKATFSVQIQQAKLPLYPLLKALGVAPAQLHDAWGPEIAQANIQQDSGAALQRTYQRLVPKFQQKTELSDQEKLQQIKEVFEKMPLDPETTKRTLGKPYGNFGAEPILAATQKLLRVLHGQEGVDDRDNPAFQTFHTMDDLLTERLRKDYGGLRKQILHKAHFKGNLQHVPAGVLNRQVDSLITMSGLAQHLSESNTSEILDQLGRVTRMGEGGLGSIDAIPRESRNVQSGHLGLMDLTRTPESMRAGVDLYFSANSRKSDDGGVQAKFKNLKTGEDEWLTPAQAQSAVVTFPQELETRRTRNVPVLDNGKLRYAPRDQVQYVPASFTGAFSPLAQITPFFSGMKGQRLAMASRMAGQALPLVAPEAPFVQAGVPGAEGQSYEGKYAKHWGAIPAEHPGQVTKVTEDEIHVKGADGKPRKYDLHRDLPLNRSTFLHQDPVVQPGDVVQPGQMLARSNYTDKEGTLALGRNARVAFMAWPNSNFEDAYAISESFGKRLTSAHMMRHELEHADDLHVGNKKFQGLFPGKYPKAFYERYDDDGVLKVGQQVQNDEPLVLAAQQKEGSPRVHKKKQPTFVDASEKWDHHAPGIVTDVVKTKKGISVVVKTQLPMQEGDKLSGRFGNKGVVKLVPDDQMPVGADGQPFEVLANPAGVITRHNPAWILESALGKIAAQTGKPYKVADFENPRDLVDFGLDELKKHGVPEFETVLDPATGRKIPQTFTGNSYFYKLEHLAEHKDVGRGAGGGYGADDTPSRGGPSGCFVTSTRVLTADGPMELGAIVENKLTPRLWSYDFAHHDLQLGRVIDWFKYRVPRYHLRELVLKDGRKVRCTWNHEFFLAGGNRKFARDLKQGTALFSVTERLQDEEDDDACS